MRRVSDIVTEYLGGVRVYPVVGNHDTYPLDMFKFNGPRETEVLNQWDAKWKQFIPDKRAMRTFLDYGYYSIDFTNKNGQKLSGLNSKIIVLNMNFCYVYNFEMLSQFKDPGNMIRWLEEELIDLENQNGTAILMSHVPNNVDCVSSVSRRFHAILDRFQATIRGLYFSHVHQEQF